MIITDSCVMLAGAGADGSIITREQRGQNYSSQDPPAPGELSEIHKKKLRIAVYDALHRSKVDEKNPLFKKCFPKLFQICKMYVLEGFDE